MDPEEEDYVPAEELRRRGAHVLTLDPTAIEGDPEADARREAVMARARNPEASRAPDRDSLAELMSRLPEIIRTSSFLPPVERAAMASFLETGEALPAHLASGATLGWSDELAGGVAALPAAARAVVSGADPQAVREARSAYEGTRDRERARLARTRAESPMTSMAGDVVGGLVMAAVPGGLAADAAMGALAGAGASDGGDDMLGDTVVGGAMGAGSSALAHGLGRAAGAAAPLIRRQADEWRVASTGAGAEDIRMLMDQLSDGGDPLTEAATTIRESGLVPAIGTADDVAVRARRAMGEVTPHEIRAASLPVPRARMADALDAAAERGRLSPADAPAMDRVGDYAARMRGEDPAGTLPFSGRGRPAGTAMHELGAMDRGAAWARPGEPTPAPEAFREARRGTRRVLDDVFAENFGLDDLAEYRAARSRAETAIPVERAASRAASRSAGHRLGGLMTGIGGGAGAGIAHMLGADPTLGLAAGVGINAGLHNYGRTARATLGDAVADTTDSFARSEPAREGLARGVPALTRILSAHGAGAADEEPARTAAPTAPAEDLDAAMRAVGRVRTAPAAPPAATEDLDAAMRAVGRVRTAPRSPR